MASQVLQKANAMNVDIGRRCHWDKNKKGMM